MRKKIFMKECLIAALYYMKELYATECANNVPEFNWGSTDAEMTFAPNVGTVTKDFTSLFSHINPPAGDSCTFTAVYLKAWA